MIPRKFLSQPNFFIALSPFDGLLASDRTLFRTVGMTLKLLRFKNLFLLIVLKGLETNYANLSKGRQSQVIFRNSETWF